MMLLDTHVLVRYARDDDKLGRRSGTAIDRALSRDEVFISAISFWELAMLASGRRIELQATMTAFRASVLRDGMQEVPIDGEIAICAGELPEAHGDPADRILVATAIIRGCTLVTADQTLLDWKLRGFRTHDATT